MGDEKFQKITAVQKLHIKHFLKEVESVKGRNTELISIYVPAGYDLNQKIQQLQQEQGTATNIKSKQTRDAVISSLERMIQHLKTFKKTPGNGLICFSGNASERDGQTDFQVWSMEPPIPSNQNLYRCDKEFLTEPLHEMVDDENIFGLVAMDKREGNIALLKGKTIIPLKALHSAVPGKHKTGGQCLVNDTSIQLASGDIIPISKAHNPLAVTGMDGTLLGECSITDKWSVPKQEVFTITTKHPRLQVSCSKDHVFFRRGETGIQEVAAEDLREGDWLLMPERIPVRGELQQLIARDYESFTIESEGLRLFIKVRKQLGLTQKELARQTQVAQATISAFERGLLNLGEPILRRLFKTVDTDFDSFTHKHIHRRITLPKTLDAKTARFVGYFLGDGHAEKDRITLFEQREEVADHYAALSEELFAIPAIRRFRTSKNYHQIRLQSFAIVKFLKDNFSECKLAGDSSIPKNVLESPAEVAAGFTRGLFDAEGYVSTGKVGIGMNNRRLIQQLQMLLLRFSIISSFLEYDNRRNKYSDNTRYSLQITEKRSLYLYREHIGFTATEKQEKLSSVIDTKSEKSLQRQILPLGSQVRSIIEEHGHIAEEYPVANMFLRDKRSMSKEIFKRTFIDTTTDEKLREALQQVYDQQLLPVRISSIETRREDVEMTDISTSKQNFIANGLIVHNSAQRFERLREGAAIEFYKRIAEYMKEEFLENQTDLKGIIVGGPGHTKYEFAEGNYITDQLKRKIIGIKDLSYTGDFGLQELLEKSQDILSEEDVVHEKQLMQRFFAELAKETGKCSYGFDDVMKATKLGASDILLVSEDVSEEDLKTLEEAAEQVGTSVEIISTATREGVQLKDMGGVAAILRYAADIQA